VRYTSRGRSPLRALSRFSLLVFSKRIETAESAALDPENTEESRIKSLIYCILWMIITARYEEQNKFECSHPIRILEKRIHSADVFFPPAVEERKMIIGVTR